MKRAISNLALTTQTFWERYEGWILVALGAALLFVCAHIGEAQVRP